MFRTTPLLAGMLFATATAVAAAGPDPIQAAALERAATLVAARGDEALSRAFATLREAGVLDQLLEVYDQTRDADVSGEFVGDGDGGFADRAVAKRCRAALRAHFQSEGMLAGDDETAEGVHFTVLRPDETRDGWFHCEAEIPGPEGSFYDCYVVNPETGSVEAEACG